MRSLKAILVSSMLLMLTACEIRICYESLCIIIIRSAQEAIENDLANGTATSANFTLEISGDNVQISNEYLDVEILALDGKQVVSSTTASIDFKGNTGYIVNVASVDNWVAGLSQPEDYDFDISVPNLSVEPMNPAQPLGTATFQVMYFSEALTQPVNIN